MGASKRWAIEKGTSERHLPHPVLPARVQCDQTIPLPWTVPLQTLISTIAQQRG